MIPGNRAQSWATLEELHGQGKLKAIGVSNYTVAHMRELMQSCKVPPAVLQVQCRSLNGGQGSCLKSHGFFCVLQVEFHPRLCQAELKSVCEEYGVCFQAYSSLGQGDLVTDPVVLEVAKQCQRTPAQVSPLALLSWVYLCFYCKYFKVLLSLSSGAAAVGGAAGCRCAPKVIKRRPNTGERQTF